MWTKEDEIEFFLSSIKVTSLGFSSTGFSAWV